MFARLKNILILLLIAVIAGLSSYIYLTLPEETQPEYTSSSVFERIVAIQEVSLVQYHYTGVVGFQDRRTIGNINIPFTKKHFLVQYDGYIKAGVDFQDLKIEVEDKQIDVEIPRARIMENVIDENSLVVYDESMNILNQTRIEDYNQSIIKEKEKMEEESVERGILAQAEEQADLLIRSMVQDMGFEEISIQLAAEDRPKHSPL